MKFDLSDIPKDEIIKDIVTLIKQKEPKAKVKKSGKNLEITGLSNTKGKFYIKKVLGASNLEGVSKVISLGDQFKVYFKEVE